MIYEQPVFYDLKDLTMPVLIIVGKQDRTFIGRDLVKKDQHTLHGNFPLLARQAKKRIKNCQIIELPNVGHIPHIQEPAAFNKGVAAFLNQQQKAIR
jgi:pimeloyl-ACP methyl ester carboxylesterase